MREGILTIWLVAFIAIPAAQPPALATRGSDCPRVDWQTSFYEIPREYRGNAWPVTPEWLSNHSMPTYAYMLQHPGTYVRPCEGETEQFRDAGRNASAQGYDYNKVAYNGTEYGQASEVENGTGPGAVPLSNGTAAQQNGAVGGGGSNGTDTLLTGASAPPASPSGAMQGPSGRNATPAVPAWAVLLAPALAGCALRRRRH